MEHVIDTQRAPADPILALRGVGRELWADEEADAYVSSRGSARAGLSRVFRYANVFVYLIDGGARAEQAPALRRRITGAGPAPRRAPGHRSRSRSSSAGPRAGSR